MDQQLDIPYTSVLDPLRSFDGYFPESPARPILVFVHGGAWGADDKAAHRILATQLAEASRCPVLVPNYRLTGKATPFQHPGHAEDVLTFLTFLTTWDGIPDIADRPVYVLGHSAGAHMLSAIMLDSSAVTPTLTPSPAVSAMVRGVVLSEGIFDIDMLLKRFPEYRAWFIGAAFGQRDSYAEVSVSKLPLRDAELQWLIVHSTGDTLVDMPQSETMAKHLQSLYGQSKVQFIIEGLTVEHDDVVLSSVFTDLVCKFVKQ
ncbi:Alpha/Beta hydrolase protein [Mycena amicta]|nr:Alpha/Beta hydrolase protein [Mycena amicta]